MNIKKLKKQLFVAVLSAMTALIAFGSSTYAWFVSNNQAKATASTISAKANSFVLQIATRTQGAQRGDNQSLDASNVGHRISPSSTNDLTNWYICQGWGQDGLVNSYSKLSGLGDDGKYVLDGDRYAYIKSEFILYTITETGHCDVYLNGSAEGGAIQVSAEGSPTSTIIPDSIRIGVTIQDLDKNGQPTGNESPPVLVYAPSNETGKGNDATGINGWTYVKDATTLAPVTYPHIYGTTYTWKDSSNVIHDYAATAVGENYAPPAVNGTTIASDVDYDGVLMRVYIWLEGTDEQCINNSNEEDLSTYNVTISLAGVAK